MECICGCGTGISRPLSDAALQASEVALELLAWDKARTEGRTPDREAERIDALVHRGALQYQRLLDTIHGERETASLAEGGKSAEDDVAGQLERLRALHAEGALSDEEFAAAKRRVLG